MSGRARFVRGAWAALLGMLSTAAAGDGDYPEYEVKAAFLRNFTKYVEWPSAAFASPREPWIVGVVGRDPFGKTLETVLGDKHVKGRSFRVRRFARAEDLGDVHVLFVPLAEAPRLPRILEKTAGRPILTVGESEAFCRAGGALAVLIENARPKLVANPEAAVRAGLTIDPRLLKLSALVGARP